MKGPVKKVITVVRRHWTRDALHWFFRVSLLTVFSMMLGTFATLMVFRAEAQATVEQRVLLNEHEVQALASADLRNEKAILILQTQVTDLNRDVSRMQGIGIGLTALGLGLAFLAVLTNPKAPK